jgi:cellulose synthase operon protein C
MTRRQILAGFLLFALLPTAALAAPAQSHSHEIEGLELQYLATKNPKQRKHAIRELKALTKNIAGEDAGTLNQAVSAMLPAADSIEEAEALLAIAAAHPAGYAAGQAKAEPADTEFLVDARGAARAARQANGDVEALADIRIDHLRKDSLGRDGLTTAHVQQIWRINSIQGARSFSPRSVTYAGMSEAPCMVRARVLKRDGRELEAVASADQPVVDRGSSMYFDSRTRDLHFSQLEPGDMVEVEYYLLPATEVISWGGYYARLDLFRDSVPTRLRRRVVIAPSTMKLYSVEHGVRPAMVRQKGEEITRIWEMGDIGAQRVEALSLGASESGPYLHVSTIGSVKEFGRWYNELLEPALKMDETLRAVAEKILRRKLSTQGKVQAVYESVQRSTKYTAFEFGVHSYQPYAVSTVERRGFGDCKDKAAMIVALLREVGVPTEFAMVRTRSAGSVVPEAYSIQLFNHAVAYVPELNLYVDGTAEYAVLGEAPLDDQGAMAMTVDAQGNATLRTVPFSAPESSRVTREAGAQINRSGKMEFAATQRMKAGETSPEKRE